MAYNFQNINEIKNFLLKKEKLETIDKEELRKLKSQDYFKKKELKKVCKKVWNACVDHNNDPTFYPAFPEFFERNIV